MPIAVDTKIKMNLQITQIIQILIQILLLIAVDSANIPMNGEYKKKNKLLAKFKRLLSY